MHAPKARTLRSVRSVNRHAPVAAIYDFNFSVPAGTEFCEAAVKWKSVADFYPQGVRGIRKAAKLPPAAQDCRARQQINLNRFLARPVRAKKLFSLRSPPSRRYDSHACSACQSCRFLETGSLHPPLAALHRFPCAPLARALRRSASLSNEGQRHSFETFTNCLHCLLLTMGTVGGTLRLALKGKEC